jgi:hypothetical protein
MTTIPTPKQAIKRINFPYSIFLSMNTKSIQSKYRKTNQQ